MSKLEGHAQVTAARVLKLPLERVEAIAAGKAGDDEGSVIVVLMCISILVNVVRIVLDHCWDKDRLFENARRPGPLMRRYVHRVMNRQCYQADPAGVVTSVVSSAELADALLERSSQLSDDELCAVVEEEETAPWAH